MHEKQGATQESLASSRERAAAESLPKPEPSEAKEANAASANATMTFSHVERLGLVAVVVVAVAAAGIFLWEGASEPQSLDTVMAVGGKTVRDVTETLTAPVLVSLAQEKQVGRAMLRVVRTLPRSHPRSQRVQRVGRRLARYRRRKALTYRFFVVRSSRPNAFALPGGYILVTTGMLELADPADDDAELAWVLGHEITHIERQHAWVPLRLWLVRQKLRGPLLRETATIARLFAHWLRLGYNETMEMEADRGGLALMRKADFLPRRAVSLATRMMERSRSSSSPHESRHPWLMGVTILRKTVRHYWATHPQWKQRKERLQAWLRSR